MAILSAAEARVYIPTLTGSAEDTLLDTLIGRAEALAGVYCGFPAETSGNSISIELATYTHYSGIGAAPVEIVRSGQALRVPVSPIGAVTSIHDDRDGSWDYDSGDLVSAADYVILKDDGLILLTQDSAHGGFSSGVRNIKVVYTAGWATAAPGLKEAIGLTLKYVFERRKTFGKIGISGSPSAITLPTLASSLPPEIQYALSAFVLPRRYL